MQVDINPIQLDSPAGDQFELTNEGPSILYYGDRNVSSTKNVGEVGPKSTVTLAFPYYVISPLGTNFSITLISGSEGQHEPPQVALLGSDKTVGGPGGSPLSESVLNIVNVPSGKPGQKRLSSIVGGINAWVDDSGGMPLEAFGAKWDKSTDDSRALEEAIAASIENNAPVLIPMGTGVIDSQPIVPKNLTTPIKIRGAGMGASTVKLPTSMSLFAFAATNPGDTLGGLDLGDFSIDGNNQNGNGIVLGAKRAQVNFTKVSMRRLGFTNIPDADSGTESGRRLIELLSTQEAGQALNVIEEIDIRECLLAGGQLQLFIGGGSSSGAFHPVNVRHRFITMMDLVATKPASAVTSATAANFQLGSLGWSDGRRILCQGLFGSNSADVCLEGDIPGVYRDIYALNANNEGVLLTSFNAATLLEPIVSLLTLEGKVGDTIVKVGNSALFPVGSQVVVFGSNTGNCETRTVKALPDSEHVELTEALGKAHPVGYPLQLVDDMKAVTYRGKNLNTKRTVTTLPGAKRGFSVGSFESGIPMGRVEVDGLEIVDTAVDAVGGHLLFQHGTTTSPGGPSAVKIKRLSIRRENLTYGGSGLSEYSPIQLASKSAPTILKEIEGTLEITGPGVTGAGKLKIRPLQSQQSGVFDVKLMERYAIGSTGGENIEGISLSGIADISGKFSIGTLPSSLSTGGGNARGLALGKSCAFASKSRVSTLTAEAVATALALSVVSTASFAVGQAIVVDALSSALCEVMYVASIEGTTINLVSFSETAGLKNTHAAGATVAVLNQIQFVDSDLTGVAGVGTPNPITAEDESVLTRVLTRGNVYATPLLPIAIGIPASTKAFPIKQPRSGTISVSGGTVTAVEWSPNGVEWFKVASGTNITFHVSPGDFVKLTYSVAPTIKFIPDRA
jgi:hypothetical protein